MYQIWTGRRTTATPPDSGTRSARLCAAALVAALVSPACSGSNKTENRIRPIEAKLNIVAFPGTPDPAVFLEPVSTTGDLVTVDVKLHNTTGTPIDFDAFTLEFIAATTIPGPPVPPNDPNAAPGRITLISGAGHGDCEILQNLGDVLVNGQPIQCTDGSAYLTGTN